MKESEYASLHQLSLHHISNVQKYLVGTITAYSIVLFWAISNNSKIYIELLTIILYVLIIFSLNIILYEINRAKEIESYIAIFHELRSGEFGWHIHKLKYRGLVRRNHFGHPFAVLLCLGITTLPFCLARHLHQIKNLLDITYPYIMLVIFTIFLILFYLSYRLHTGKYIHYLEAAIKIARERKSIPKKELEKLKVYLNI
jgi:hypothetical protein